MPILLFAVGCFTFVGYMIYPCGKTEIGRYPSPDYKRVVVVAEGSCGATTGFSTYVTLERVGLLSWFSDTERVLSIDGLHHLKPTWSGNGTLQIALPDTEIYYRKTQIDDVTISYVENHGEKPP